MLVCLQLFTDSANALPAEMPKAHALPHKAVRAAKPMAAGRLPATADAQSNGHHRYAFKGGP